MTTDFRKPLRPGNWVNFVNLPPGTTNVQLHAFLQSRGMQIAFDDIRMHKSGEATVVYPKAELVALINWVIDGTELSAGFVPTAEEPRSTHPSA